MTLCVSGRADMGMVLEVVDRILPEREQKTIIRNYYDEKPEVYRKRVSAEFEVAKPMFLIGVKDIDIAPDGAERMRKKAVMGILIDMLFGSTSPFALDVYESGLVNGFEAGYDHGRSSSIVYLEENRKAGLSREDFDRIKRASYASYLKNFDSTRLAQTFTYMIHDDCDPFDYGDTLKSVTFEETSELFGKLFHEEYYAMSVINPIGK